MDFFGGLAFSMSGSVPRSREEVHNEPRYYGIQFNYSGTMYLAVDHGPRCEVSGPHAFLTEPGHFFEYGPAAGTVRHHNFICSCGPRIRRYLDGGLWLRAPVMPPVPILHAEDFLRKMLEIMALTDRPGPEPPRAVLLFEDLLLRIQEALHAERRHIPYQAEELNILIDRVSAAPEGDWDFSNEAAKMHMTLTHFRRIFKELSGLPPQQFLQHCRLRKAAELLHATRLPLKEVAAQSGWDNVFYFSRLFRRKYALSPGRYRREFHA